MKAGSVRSRSVGIEAATTPFHESTQVMIEAAVSPGGATWRHCHHGCRESLAPVCRMEVRVFAVMAEQAPEPRYDETLDRWPRVTTTDKRRRQEWDDAGDHRRPNKRRRYPWHDSGLSQ
jgi:hypothetical protein